MKKTALALAGLMILGGSAISQTTEMEKEMAAVKAAALDYIEGAHEGNADRIARSVHTELCKVSVRNLPQTGKEFLNKAGFSRLAELVRANQVPLPPEKRNIEITVFAVREGLACARAVSSSFYDYLQLAKIDGTWKLINVLWRYNPSHPNGKVQGEPPDPDEEKAAIKQAALDYLEGFFSGDAERMAKAVHPELNKILPVTLPQTNTTMLNYASASSLVEAARAKVGLVDEDKRNIQFKILDVQNEIAMAEVLSSMYYDYLQLAKLNGEWKIVNVLWKMNPDAPRPKR
jgi:hypothetical protein